MRGFIWAALLSFAGFQLISLTECPCAALCHHKNACDEDDQPSNDDCCKESRGRSENGPIDRGLPREQCLHWEPQSEIDSPVLALLDLEPHLLGIPPVPACLGIDPEPARPVVSYLFPRPRDGPLYLNYSALLL